jgi:flagellar biosynthetic protein FliP
MKRASAFLAALVAVFTLVGVVGAAMAQPVQPVDPIIVPSPVTTAPSAAAVFGPPDPGPLAPPGGPVNPFDLPKVEVSLGGGEGDWVGALRVLGLMTVLTLAPGILLTMTAFTRIIIVLGFLRQAIGTMQSPPNQVLLALSMFMTIFIMQPVWSRVHQDALQPYMAGEITQEVALEKASTPVRNFMFAHTRKKDLALFIKASGENKPQTEADVATWQLIPAFIISELKTAFQMGFMIYVPFLVLDMVVSAILMAMGMMMLPPVLISMPFKLMLFVLVDGWNLLVGSLIRSFNA